MTNNTCKNLYELQLDTDQIPEDHRFSKRLQIDQILEITRPNDYIGISYNDFSQTHIYRRSSHSTLADLSVLKWDGKTTDTSWYNKENTVLLIQNAEQLAGLKYLVENGETFEGKTIKLTSNINLNNMEWSPIGDLVINDKVGSRNDYFFDIGIADGKSFQGIFDGCGFHIYGLKMTKVDAKDYFIGFFKSLKNAVIKNICFSNVWIGSSDRYSYFSTLFGYAEGCRFENIYVTGSIIGQHCASIGCVALNSSFSYCINYASLNGRGNHSGCSIMIGGLVMQTGLSEKTVEQLGGKVPTLFSKCWQKGRIVVDGNGIGSLFVGQLYGNAAYAEDTSSPYGFIVDRCHVSSDNLPIIDRLTDGAIRGVFYGKKGADSDPINFVTGVTDKNDLLCGLIGKTNSNLSVTVNKITSSTKVDNMVIRGSLNILKSEEGSTTFMTKDVSNLREEDSIENLEPYFTFIKAVKS